MADEISLTLGLSYEKNGVELAVESLAAVGVDVSGSRFIHRTQQIGTTEEALDIAELASLGVAWFRNLDTANYLEIRSATGAGNDIIKLLAGEAWCFRCGSDVSAPFAIANTAAIYLEFVIFET